MSTKNDDDIKGCAGCLLILACCILVAVAIVKLGSLGWLGLALLLIVLGLWLGK